VAALETPPLRHMSQAIRIRAKLKSEITEAVILMPHAMETGLRHNSSGALLPAHYITEMRATVNGRLVLEARLTMAMSQDPLLRFRFRGAAVGDLISVSWTDNQGQRRSDDAAIV
jgi:sulfur-oxidizing protein SoxZ